MILNDITATVLVDDTCTGRGLMAEHGWSVWVRAGGSCVLFDTGQSAGSLLEHNAARSGIDLGAADAIVLSHGHYDHTGGLLPVLAACGGCPVYAHPAVFECRYAGSPGACREIGAGVDEAAVRAAGGELVWTEGPTEVVPGLWVTGAVPRVTSFEDTGGDFYRDSGCTQADPIVDDQALFAETAAGRVVILGCSHAGVVNTLYRIAELGAGAGVHAVVGGMHLGRASAARLERTCAALASFSLAGLGPAHCTGFAASAHLYSEFRKIWLPAGVGARWSFPLNMNKG